MSSTHCSTLGLEAEALALGLFELPQLGIDVDVVDASCFAPAIGQALLRC